jgi:hypothetical protein
MVPLGRELPMWNLDFSLRLMALYGCIVRVLILNLWVALYITLGLIFFDRTAYMGAF